MQPLSPTSSRNKTTMLVGQSLENQVSDVQRNASSSQKHLVIRWHPCRDILAVSTYSTSMGGFVGFFTQQGGKPFFSSVPRKELSPTCISWHHREPWLAVGWSGGHPAGCISVVEPLEKKEHEILCDGLGDVLCTLWCPHTLIAIDEKGMVKSLRATRQAEPSSLRPDNGTTSLNETPTDICAKLVEREQWERRNSTRPRGMSPKGEVKEKFADPQKEGNDERLPSNAAKQVSNTVLLCVISTDKGGVFLYDASTTALSRVFQADSSIRQLLDTGEAFDGRDGYLLVITEGMMFYQIAFEKRLANDRIKVKLGGKPSYFSMIRIDFSVIALCYGEQEIRIWDLAREDSSIFHLVSEKGYDVQNHGEEVVCLSYCGQKESISAATATGKMASWKRYRHNNAKQRTGREFNVEEQWALQSAVLIGDDIGQMAWSHTPMSALAVSSGSSVQIFLSRGIDFSVGLKYAVVQLGQQSLSIVKLNQPVETSEFQPPINLKGFTVAESSLFVWDNEKLHFYEISQEAEGPIRTRTIAVVDIPPTLTAAIYSPASGHLYLMGGEQISMVGMDSSAQKPVELHEREGQPILMDANGDWLVVATSHGHLRIYDTKNTSTTPALRSISSVGRSATREFRQFLSAKVNAMGNKVSFTVQDRNEETCERLFVWDAEVDSFGFFSFRSGMTDQQHSEVEDEGLGMSARSKTTVERRAEKERHRYQLQDYLPGNHFWNMGAECRGFLACEANHVGGSENSLILTMFAASEHGIVLHDLQPRPWKAETLIALAVPHLYYLKNIESDEADEPEVECSISRLILRRTLREFIGINPKEDENGVESMLDFSYYLCVGQMDSAFKAIKHVKRSDIWAHMAKMCVKSQRIDVARVCLGNMGNARAARALRLCVARDEPVELQTARLAIELEMIDEAILIYGNAGRYDLVNRIYQAQDKWKEAFEVAEKFDRIHLRNTHYNYARHLENAGAIEAAIESYEKASVFEVPRMLLEKDPKLLEPYIQSKADPELAKWWAAYHEQMNNVEMARKYYSAAKDYASVVRLLCHSNQLQDAVALVERTGDKAAAFHLAQYCKTLEDYQNAVKYFEMAGALNNAINVAKENDMMDQLARLSSMTGDEGLMLEVASYYEEMPGHADKAVMLCHKAGMLGKALDVAFKTEQFGALDLIARELNADSDPRVLERAALFYSNNQQDRKAVELLAHAKKLSDAIALCGEKNVIITEELDALLTPPKTDGRPEQERRHLFEEIARCCVAQGNYRLAAKKYTQAGNKIEAMRALVKSGDTSKIILFTNTARTKDIYRMAGNYLQTSLDWKEDTGLMRQIEQFYLKAEAFDSIASFYEACAEIEIDEYRNYEKAIAAYNEAIRCLRKKGEKVNEEDASSLRTTSILLQRQEALMKKVHRINRFLELRSLYDNDPTTAVRKLTEMAEEKENDGAVRLGDICGLLIEHNAGRENFRRAWQLIERCMDEEPIDVRKFVRKETLDKVCSALGVHLPSTKTAQDQIDEDEVGASVDYSHALRRKLEHTTEAIE